jgi:hypothetical protein
LVSSGFSIAPLLSWLFFHMPKSRRASKFKALELLIARLLPNH